MPSGSPAPDNATLYRIDRATNVVSEIPLPATGIFDASVTATATTVYVGLELDAEVPDDAPGGALRLVAVDAATSAVVTSVETFGQVETMAVDTSGLWVLLLFGDGLGRFDPGTLAEGDRIDVEGGGLALAPPGVWVSTADGLVAYEATASAVEVPLIGGAEGKLAAATGAVGLGPPRGRADPGRADQLVADHHEAVAGADALGHERSAGARAAAATAAGGLAAAPAAATPEAGAAPAATEVSAAGPRRAACPAHSECRRCPMRHRRRRRRSGCRRRHPHQHRHQRSSASPSSPVARAAVAARAARGALAAAATPAGHDREAAAGDAGTAAATAAAVSAVAAATLTIGNDAARAVLALAADPDDEDLTGLDRHGGAGLATEPAGRAAVAGAALRAERIDRRGS